MNVPSMHRLQWQLGEAYRAFGWPGLTVIPLLVACLIGYLLALSPLEQAVRDIRSDTQRVYGGARKAALQASADDPVGQLEQFYDYFQKTPVMEDALALIQWSASEESLALPQGEYRLIPARDGKLARYELTFPMRGSYPQLRRFIARALGNVPSLALEGITFSRKSVADTMVDAQVRMVLFLPEP